MSINSLTENYTGCDNLLCEQLDLFSNIQEDVEVWTDQLDKLEITSDVIKETIKKCLLLENNNVFKNDKIEIFFLDLKEDEDFINIKLNINLWVENYKIKLSFHKLKKYIYPIYLWERAKWMSGAKIMLELNLNINDIIKNINDINSVNVDINTEEYHYTPTKPLDIKKREVEKKPESNFSNSRFEINWNETTIYFQLNWYSFRVTKIETSKINQRNWGVDDENVIIQFNKSCLNNIGIYLDNDGKSGWTSFTSSKFKFYEYNRWKISTYIFNELNSYRYLEVLEKTQ